MENKKELKKIQKIPELFEYVDSYCMCTGCWKGWNEGEGEKNRLSFCCGEVVYRSRRIVPKKEL